MERTLTESSESSYNLSKTKSYPVKISEINPSLNQIQRRIRFRNPVHAKSKSHDIIHKKNSQSNSKICIIKGLDHNTSDYNLKNSNLVKRFNEVFILNLYINFYLDINQKFEVCLSGV